MKIDETAASWDRAKGISGARLRPESAPTTDLEMHANPSVSWNPPETHEIYETGEMAASWDRAKFSLGADSVPTRRQSRTWKSVEIYEIH